MKTSLQHKAYILRLWQQEGDQECPVIATLDDCQTNERLVFASLAALLAYLETALPEPPNREAAPLREERTS